MAIGDYAKTVYISGQAPAISASNLNKNENKTDEVDKALASHTAETATDAHLAKNIGIEDVDGNFVSTNVEGAMTELFTSVSDGKGLVGTAITDVDPSVTVPTDPTFAELVAAIGQISTGKSIAKGTGTTDGSGVLTITGLSFQPNDILIGSKGASPFRWTVRANTIPLAVTLVDNFVISSSNPFTAATASHKGYNITVSSNGFTCGNLPGNTQFDWTAYGA